MKKTYEKPQIFFENFALSTNIATGCERLVNNPLQGTCAVIGSGNIAMFDNTISACDYEQSNDMYDGFCYHVPIDTNNLFNS